MLALYNHDFASVLKAKGIYAVMMTYVCVMLIVNRISRPCFGVSSSY